MKGCLIICSVHNQAHNSSKREWQIVSQEMMQELRAMAEEVGNVDVWEGVCPQCVGVASDIFNALYASRYANAQYAEFGSDVIFPKGDASES